MNTGLANQVLLGSRKYAGGAKRFLGHGNNAIKLLGSTTKSINKLGYNSSALNKLNSFAQDKVAPFLQKVEGAI